MTAAHPLPLYHTALFNSLKQWYSFLFLKKCFQDKWSKKATQVFADQENHVVSVQVSELVFGTVRTYSIDHNSTADSVLVQKLRIYPARIRILNREDVTNARCFWVVCVFPSVSNSSRPGYRSDTTFTTSSEVSYQLLTPLKQPELKSPHQFWGSGFSYLSQLQPHHTQNPSEDACVIALPISGCLLSRSCNSGRTSYNQPSAGLIFRLQQGSFQFGTIASLAFCLDPTHDFFFLW